MDNKFNEVRRLVEEDDELKTSDRYTKVRAKNHLFEWSGQQLDILLRRVAGAKKVLTNLLSKKADLVDGKVPKSQLPSDIGGGSAFNDYTKAGGTKTQEEFNPAFVNSVDNSDLFFILPKGTQFPYTLTEDDKSNLAKALFIIATSSSGRTAVYAKTINVINGYQGYWINSENAGNSAVLGVSDKVVSAPSFVNFGLVTYTPQTLTDEQKEQARANIGMGYPMRQIIDLYHLVGYNCYAVYRFDDSGYYVLCQYHVVKLSLTLQKVYDLSLMNNFNRTESGRDRNLCCKIGNKVFFAVCDVSKPVYMYNEDTGEGKYLENPSGLQYYGSIYAIDEKVYYFHRYQLPNVYVYSKDGELLQTIENEHGFIKYTEGTAFTNDGYKVNLSDFSFEPLSFPIEQSGYYYYIFKNGNIIKGTIAISGDNNQKGYLFSSYPSSECDVAFNTNKYTIVYSPQGKLVFTYPHGITNSVSRQQFIDFVIGDGGTLSVRKTSLYEKQVYMVDMYNHLIIEDVSLYVTD